MVILSPTGPSASTVQVQAGELTLEYDVPLVSPTATGRRSSAGNEYRDWHFEHSPPEQLEREASQSATMLGVFAGGGAGLLASTAVANPYAKLGLALGGAVVGGWLGSTLLG